MGRTIIGKPNPIKTKDIRVFIDNSGNVTQIEKQDKSRFKYYIDPTYTDMVLNYCAIGISDEEFGECSYGIALGIGDNLMAFAKYS